MRVKYLSTRIFPNNMFTSHSNPFISVPLDFKVLAKGFSQELDPLLTLSDPPSATTVSVNKLLSDLSPKNILSLNKFKLSRFF